MESKREQCALKRKLCFRIFVFAISMLITLGYVIWNKNNATIWTVMVGFSGSAAVWALVEIVDFFIETYQTFEKESNDFSIMIEEHWSKLRDIFRSKSEAKDVPWEDVFNNVNDLYNDIAAFPFHGNVYPISEEFEKAAYYITRLYWKADGYKYSKKRNDTQEYWEAFYKTFVMISDDLPGKSKKTLEEIMQLNEKIDKLRDIDVTFKEFDHPKGMIDYCDVGDLGKTVSLPSGEIQYKTFKPAYDFHREFNENQKDGVIVTVVNLLRRKTKQWDGEDE